MAKSRSELPHLYYPKANTVRVINAHRGGSSGTIGFGTESMILRASTGAVDQSLNGNDATLLDGASVVGGKFALDGDDDLITASNTVGAFASGESFWCGLWFRGTDVSYTVQSAFLCKGYQPTEQRPWWFVGPSTNGNVVFVIRNTAGATKSVTSTGTIHDGSEHLVVARYDADAAKIILSVDDGSPVEATSVAADSYGTGSQLLAVGATLDRFFEAELDDIRMASGKLTNQQVLDWFIAGPGYNA